MRPFKFQFIIIFISKLGMLHMFMHVELYYFMIRTDWLHCGFKCLRPFRLINTFFCSASLTFQSLRTWTWGRSARMKGLVSNSSSMVDGIVGSPDCLCCWAHDNFCDILALSGSTVWANCKFFTVYWESNKYGQKKESIRINSRNWYYFIIL